MRQPESLIFIDMALYANEDSSSAVTWRNAEVIELLRDIRVRLLEDLRPTLFAIPAERGANSER